MKPTKPKKPAGPRKDQAAQTDKPNPSGGIERTYDPDFKMDSGKRIGDLSKAEVLRELAYHVRKMPDAPEKFNPEGETVTELALRGSWQAVHNAEQVIDLAKVGKEARLANAAARKSEWLRRAKIIHQRAPETPINDIAKAVFLDLNKPVQGGERDPANEQFRVKERRIREYLQTVENEVRSDEPLS